MAGNEQEMAQELFGGKTAEQSMERSMGAMEAVGEGLKAFGELMAWGMEKTVFSPGGQHFIEHGAHELAAALFGNGHPFVMYPDAGKENQLYGPEAAMEGFPRLYEASGPEQSQDMQQEHQRGGRSM